MMTLSAVRDALNIGLTVCWKTSRYEVYMDAHGDLHERDIYNDTGSALTVESAVQCFIKTGWYYGR